MCVFLNVFLFYGCMETFYNQICVTSLCALCTCIGKDDLCSLGFAMVISMSEEKGAIFIL